MVPDLWIASGTR